MRDTYATLHLAAGVEVSDVGFEEPQVVLDCLAGLAGRPPKAAAEALAALVHRRGSKQAGEALLRWAR